MAIDPYDNMPSKEDLEKAGATDWLSDVLAEQKKKDASLRAALGSETKSLKARQKGLEGLLDLPPEEDPEGPPPDLFADERAGAAKKNAALAALMGDLDETRAAEQEMLKNLFGP